jgi:hypothetical protein
MLDPNEIERPFSNATPILEDKLDWMQQIKLQRV